MIWFWFWLLIALTFITLVGHGIWAFLAFMFRTLFGLREPELKARCSHCGRQTNALRPSCDWCGHLRQAAAPSETDDLAAVERQLARWKTGGQLKPVEAERFLARLMAYRQSQAAGPSPVSATATGEHELARLLAGFADLSLAGQQRALAIYDRMTPAQRAALKLSVQIDLARLLSRLGRIEDAIGVYRRVVEIHPHELGTGRIALEAARLCIQRRRAADASGFLSLVDLPQLQAEKEILASSLEKGAGFGARGSGTQAENEQLVAAVRSEAAGESPEPVMAVVVETPQASAMEPPLQEKTPQRAEERSPITAGRPGRPSYEARPAAAPRRSLAEVLSTFMEERNIRWGELVGGLLIVCSSVALVISLWETLKTIPYFQFFIFVGVSAALFGAGLYTEHRWKLASTSRGILTIATLLVPLNFVAMAGTAREQWDVAAAITQFSALAIFSVLMRQAGRVLVDRWHTWLTVAVVGGSGMLLLVPHQPALGWAMILAMPVVVTATAAVGRAVTDVARRERVTGGDISRLFLLLGCVMFAAAVTLGLVVARSGDRAAALNILSPPAAVCGTLVALCGLFAMRAMSGEAEAGLRTTGTAIGLVGAALMLAALGLSWPLPAAMIAVGLFDFAALAYLAVRNRLAALHTIAIACLTLAYATAAHVALGNLSVMERVQPSMTLLRSFASAQTGTTLVGLFVALAIAAEWFSRRGRTSDALAYVGGCGAVAAASVSLVAWRGYEGGHADAWRAAIVSATYGLGCLALNLRWRRPLATYAGAALVGGALVYILAFSGTVNVPHRWIVIALSQATWTLIASVLCRLSLRERTSRSEQTVQEDPRYFRGAKGDNAFVGPLRQWGIVASLWAVVVFVFSAWQRPIVLSVDLAWLAALWLLLAITQRSPRWFAAFQAAVYASAAFAVTSWLNEQPWVVDDPSGLLHPRSLQVYGIAWSAVGLVWIIFHATTRDQKFTTALAGAAIDRLVQYALVLGSLALAIGAALPGVVAEYLGSQLSAVAGIPVAAWQAHAHDAFGWGLVGLLAAGIVTAGWHRWKKADLVAAVLLLVNAALLVAGPAAASQATASALRWSLAGVFVIGSICVWFRGPLARVAAQCKCRIELGPHADQLAAGLLLAMTAAPVVCFSGLVAGMKVLGNAPAGPLPGIWLADVGFSVSHLVPLTLVVIGLVGYAVREGSPGYAFAAGIVANLTVTGGYALNLSQFGATEAARLAQLATITAAVWGIGWLAVRRRVLAFGGRSESPNAWSLLRLQWAQCALGNLALLTSAFALIAIESDFGAGSGVHDWIAAVGAPLGWLSLIVACAAGRLSGWQRGRPMRPEIVGLMGVTVLGLAACSVEAMLPGTPWAYRTLMLGWASYALSVVAATWWATAVLAPAGAEGPPTALVRTAAVWVRAAGLLALLLGLKTVFADGPDADEPLWGAAAIGIASAAAAAMAVWQRREGWAFVAGLGVNLSSSIVVWHRLGVDNLRVADELVWFLQANLIAAAVVALLWLAARRRMYAGREPSIVGSPFLSIQLGSLAVGNLLLTGFGLLDLVVWPSSTSGSLAQYGAAAGWFAWLLASAAVAIHLYQIARRELVHLIAISLLGVGVLAAISIAQGSADWQAYHALIVAWTAVAFGLLAAGGMARQAMSPSPSVGNGLRAVPPRGGTTTSRPSRNGTESVPYSVSSESGENVSRVAAFSIKAQALRWLAPAREVETWLTLIAGALAALAIRSAASDPLRPWWPMAAALSASGVAAGPALWLRKHQHVYSSGLLVNLAVSIFWYAQEDGAFGDLLLINAIALAATGIGWSLISRLTRAIEAADPTEAFPPFEHAAVALSVALVAVVAWLAWCSAWLSIDSASTVLLAFDARLAWAALGCTIAALMVAMADLRVAFCPAGFYAAGLAAVALALAQQGWSGRELLWATGPALAGWALMVAIKGSGFRVQGSGVLVYWFTCVQAVIAGTSMLLGVWIALSFDTPIDRTAGGISSMLLLGAAGCMLRGAEGRPQTWWQTVILSLAVLAPAEGLWIICEGDTPTILWIHREVALLVSLALAIVGYEFFAPRLLAPASSLAPREDVLSRSESRRSAWRQVVARFLPVAIGLTLAVLAIVLVQERAQYIPHEGVPMALIAKLTVAVMLMGLILLALMYAVLEHRDPLRLSPRDRTAYVYAAEALAVLVFVHARTTMPKLIPFGVIENWWTLIVMLVAFVGAGLADFFERRRLSVLAEPLARTALLAPLLPAAAPLAALVWLPDERHVWLVGARLFSNEAALFLVAAFYGIQAALRRSLGLATLAVLSGNAGLWLLWHRLHLEFLVHPQLWLIPPALAALVAEYINRDRLKPEQSGAVRYLALSTIYVASTADVFISHVDRHISLPLVLVLLGLSVAGVLAGMLLRIRSFLYLGFTFLLVDLSVMVYHAAWDLGHTWVFYGTGIVVGLAILALFGVFEKRRNDVVLAIERFKEWQ